MLFQDYFSVDIIVFFYRSGVGCAPQNAVAGSMRMEGESICRLSP